jgi:protein TonB
MTIKMKVVFFLLCMSLVACTTQPQRPTTPFLVGPLKTPSDTHYKPIYPDQAMPSDYLPGFRPQPEYPLQAKRDGQQGRVVLRVLVDQVGKVKEVEIMKSSDFPLLDEAASNAVMRAKFREHLETA